LENQLGRALAPCHLEHLYAADERPAGYVTQARE
jgi:hypothetical protein